MGSWNGTCALTNLPLSPGTPVVGYVLHLFGGQYPGSGFVRANDLAHPVGPALWGEYNGYGGFGNFHGPALAWWRARLAEMTPELMTAEASSLEPETVGSLEAFINDGVAENCVYHGLASKQNSDDYAPDIQYGLMLVHADAHACFMASAQSSDGWCLEDGISPHSYYLEKLGNVEMAMQAVVDAELAGKTKDAAYTKLRSTVFRSFDTMGAFRHNSTKILTSVFRHIKEHNDEALLAEVANTFIFDLGLELARKSWNRQCGTGSGNDDFELQLALARFIVAKAG